MIVKYTGKDNPKPATVLSGAGKVLGKPELKDFLCIRVAGNEQMPLDFASDYVKASRGPIKTFDYAIESDQDNWAIERKGLSDFISSFGLTKNWQHELAKVERAKVWGKPIIYVLEFHYDDIAKYDYAVFPSGRVTSQFIHKRRAYLTYKHNVHFEFTGSREAAAYEIAVLLKQRNEDLRALKLTGQAG